MKKLTIEKVKSVEYDEEGNPVFNLSDTQANDDWIRAARLQKKGKLKELRKMEETPMVRVQIIEEEDDDEPGKPKDTNPNMS